MTAAEGAAGSGGRGRHSPGERRCRWAWGLAEAGEDSGPFKKLSFMSYDTCPVAPEL